VELELLTLLLLVLPPVLPPVLVAELSDDGERDRL
jgi:hypothetical protein